jgi:hypothetical protein
VNSDEIFLMCPFQTVTYSYLKRFQATCLTVGRRETYRRHTEERALEIAAKSEAPPRNVLV